MAMKLFQVDSFTNVKFKGNPAGVCLVEEFFETSVMQNIALEMNVSETAFVEIRSLKIRYFTPRKEVPLCGHATLASAHILYQENVIQPNSHFILHATECDLPIKQLDSWTQMDFPLYYITKEVITSDIREAFGINPTEIYISENGWRIIHVNSEQEVKESKPQFEKLKGNRYGSLIAVTAESQNPDFNFVVRVFCDPDSGIYEDPVTGAANSILFPFWHKKTGLTKFRSKQLSQRTGEMRTELNGDKVTISGQAVTVMNICL